MLVLRFSDWSRIWGHADRDHVYGLRKGESGGCTTGQFQQPPQSCGVPAHCESHIRKIIWLVPPEKHLYLNIKWGQVLIFCLKYVCSSASDDFFPFLAFFRYATWNIKKTTVLTDQHASLLWKETLFLGRKVCTTWHSLRSTHSSTVPLTSHRGPATTTQLCVCVLLLHSLEKSHFGNRIAN